MNGKIPKKKEKKASLHSLSRELPPVEEVASLMSSLTAMEPRAAALIMVSYLEHLLETALSYCFVKLSNEKYKAIFRDKQAPFSNFSNKISIAYALGVVDENTRMHLEKIRIIRNAFAHSMHRIDFNHQIIAAECDTLSPSTISGTPFNGSSPREKFLGTATLIGIVIMSFTRDRHLAIQSGNQSRPNAYVCNFKLLTQPEENGLKVEAPEPTDPLKLGHATPNAKANLKKYKIKKPISRK